MSQQLLWVDGARAQQQGCIQTARERQTLIRSHAQRHRTAPVMGHVHGSCLAGDNQLHLRDLCDRTNHWADWLAKPFGTIVPASEITSRTLDQTIQTMVKQRMLA
jgi:hypothetical protein